MHSALHLVLVSEGRHFGMECVLWFRQQQLSGHQAWFSCAASQGVRFEDSSPRRAAQRVLASRGRVASAAQRSAAVVASAAPSASPLAGARLSARRTPSRCSSARRAAAQRVLAPGYLTTYL